MLNTKLMQIYGFRTSCQLQGGRKRTFDFNNALSYLAHLFL